MTDDVILTLGDFEFSRSEVPEHINFGGEQHLSVHKYIGGKRTIDAMGEQPDAVTWSGLFTGSAAFERARYLDTLRKAGGSLDLTWYQMTYTVVIQSFKADFTRSYWIPYSIICEVLSDNSEPIMTIADPGIDYTVATDASDAQSLSDIIGDPSLASKIADVQSAISTVASVAKATSSEASAILTKISQARAVVGGLVANVGTFINAPTTLGGIVAGVNAVTGAAGLVDCLSALGHQQSLVALHKTLGRIALNVQSARSGTKQLVVASGDLLAIAADQYGDPMGWTAIANANGLTDPKITSVRSLAIPTYSNDTGGVLDV
jgi:hypothetical protein